MCRQPNLAFCRLHIPFFFYLFTSNVTRSKVNTYSNMSEEIVYSYKKNSGSFVTLVSITPLFIFIIHFIVVFFLFRRPVIPLFLSMGRVQRERVCRLVNVVPSRERVFSARRAVSGSLQSRRQVHAGRTLFVWRDDSSTHFLSFYILLIEQKNKFQHQDIKSVCDI